MVANITSQRGEVDYVVSMNLIRRHLDTGQRAMIAAELSTLSHGGDRSKPQNCGLPAKDAAKKLKVSRRSVETAKSVQKADPALAEEVKQGKTKLALAVKQTRAKTSAKSSAVVDPSNAQSKAPARLPLKKTVGLLIDQYGYDAVSDAALEHNP